MGQGSQQEGVPSESDSPRSYVYFARIWGTTTWKIGYSRNPQKRRKTLQTGNQALIHVRYVIPEAGRVLKAALLRYTSNNRCRKGRGGVDWREGLTVTDIKTIIRRVRVEGTKFLDGPPLPRKING